MPTVVIDVRANHDTGVSRFGLTGLAAIAPRLTEAGVRQLVIAQTHQLDRVRRAVRGADAIVLPCPDEQTGFVRRSAWLRELFANNPVDLYFTSHYTVDRLCPVPFVFTIHDLNRLHFPELSYSDASFVKKFGRDELELIRAELRELTGDERRDRDVFPRYFEAITRDLAQRAELVTTVSHTVADDIVDVLAVDPQRVRVVPALIDTATFRPRPSAVVRTALGLPGPYLLFVGLTHPNKRAGWLVEQLVAARHRFPADARLVLVGGHAEKTPEITTAVARHGAEDFVVYSGRVSDDDLVALYGGAAALVTASVSEGSNLPAQEAMACGCPVIATDIPTHRETLQGAAALYPPERGDRLVELAAAALAGRRPADPRAYRPPSVAAVGRALSAALMTALASAGQLAGAR